jgi:hypothetical protein
MKEVTNPSSSSGNLTQTPGLISSSQSAWVNQQHLNVCVYGGQKKTKKNPSKIFLLLSIRYKSPTQSKSGSGPDVQY